jgi:integrase
LALLLPVDRILPRAFRQKRHSRAIVIPELQAIMEIADPEWQSLIRFGLYTGQRLVDLATLTWC